MINIPVSTPNRNPKLLLPLFANRYELALRNFAIAEPKQTIVMFEGWRSPDRQDYLFDQGRGSPGRVVTHASSWQSWHQFGVAADFARLDNGKWNWDFDTALLRKCMLDAGLERGPDGDDGHFELTGGLTLADAQRINKSQGVLAVWDHITRLLIR